MKESVQIHAHTVEGILETVHRVLGGGVEPPRIFGPLDVSHSHVGPVKDQKAWRKMGGLIVV